MPRGKAKNPADVAAEELIATAPIPDVKADPAPSVSATDDFEKVNSGFPNVHIAPKEDKHPGTDKFEVYGFDEGGFAVYNPEGKRISGALNEGAAHKLAGEMQAHYKRINYDVKIVKDGARSGF